MYKLDSVDIQLLQWLQNDAKLTIQALASKVNLSKTAVFERIRKLEKEKVIQQYVAIIDPKTIGKSFLAFCMIQLDKHTQINLIEFEENVKKIPEILECFHVSGTYDYLLKIRVRDVEAYREFMVNTLTLIPHISNTQSAFSISEIKSSGNIF